MERLAIQLALQGALVLTVGLVAGVLLYRAILRDGRVAAWHLVHAGVAGRGVLLLALAATLQYVALPPWHVAALAWLVVFFVWTSTLAMVIAAATGDRGDGWTGSTTNRLVFALYVAGAAAVFPAAVLLIVGFFRALLVARST